MNFYLKYQVPLFVGSIATNYIYHHHNQIQCFLGLKQMPNANQNEIIDKTSYVSKSFEDNIDKVVSEIRDYSKKKSSIKYLNDFLFQGDYTQNKDSIKLNGKGILKNKDGTFEMAGNFKDNYLEGPGALVLPDGSVTKCEFINGKLIGQGILYLDDMEYRGQLEGGKPVGNGLYLFQNGSSIIAYEDNQKEFAKMFDKDGNLYYKGEFKDKVPEGFGEIYLSNGSYYKGMFHKGCRQGYGELFDKYGDLIYQGQFENDLVKHKILLYEEPLISLGLTIINGGLYLWKYL